MSLMDIIGLIVVALLVSFLCRRHEASVCRRFGESTLHGRGIDLTVVSRRILHLREDYLAVVSARPRDNDRHRQMREAVRCSLKQLAYFREARPQAEDTQPDETNAQLG